jgi:hypothetical protein
VGAAHESLCSIHGPMLAVVRKRVNTNLGENVESGTRQSTRLGSNDNGADNNSANLVEETNEIRGGYN